MCCYPILTISAVVGLSRKLERSYPQSASSRKSVSSASFFSELLKRDICFRVLIEIARYYHHWAMFDNSRLSSVAIIMHRGLPRTPQFHNIRPINNTRNHHQSRSNPRHNLNPFQILIDAIKTCIYLTKTRVYMTYDGFFPFLLKYLTDILQIRLR